MISLHPFDDLLHYQVAKMLVQVSVWTQPELNLKKKKKKKEKTKAKNKTGFYSKNSAPTDLNSIWIPLEINSEIQSRGVCNHWGLQTAKLLSDRQMEAQVYRIRGARTCFGFQRRRVHYSTSLGPSVLSFLMTGRGWASVLKTQWSNGRWSSSEKSR